MISAQQTATVNQVLAAARLSLRRGNAIEAKQLLLNHLNEPAIAGTDALTPAYELLFAIMGSRREFDELLPLTDTAIMQTGETPSAVLAKINCLRALQQQTKAITLLRTLLANTPDNAAWLMLLGLLQNEQGEAKQALESFNRALQLNPTLYEAYWLRADLLSEPTTQQLEQMQHQLTHCLQDTDKAQLGYALARAYEKQYDYAASFKALEAAANAKRRTLRFNIADEINEHQLIARQFNSPVSRKISASNTCTPIFICGLPRSGTTLIEQILSCHSQVSAGDELFELAQATADILPTELSQIPFPGWVQHADEALFQQIGKRYLQRTKRLQHTAYFTDKMPLNYKAIGIICRALPQARIVYCQRHPMDIIFSCYKQLFADGIAFSYQLDELAAYYRAHHQLMQHWLTLYPQRIHVVTYEQLVQQQETQSRQLLQHLQLPWQDSCLQFHQNKRAVFTVSSNQVRQPLFRHGIGHWQHYRSQLQDVTTQLSDEINHYEAHYL